jgi:hypothetical protein
VEEGIVGDDLTAISASEREFVAACAKQALSAPRADPATVRQWLYAG